MPELPELIAISEKLSKSLNGEEITQVSVNNPIVIYGITVEEFKQTLRNKKILDFSADGKFLLITLSEEMELVINPMLTGRFYLRGIGGRPSRTDIFRLRCKSRSLWYSDMKKMGRVYLVEKGDYSSVAGFEERGPSALDPDLDLDTFTGLLKRQSGQIKNVLRNQRFVKGIGNAYADEILLYAGILPFRKRSSLSKEEIEQLFSSMKNILARFTEILRNRSLEEIALEKRDFMMIHGKKGSSCPLCGGRISEVTANRYKTNFCQSCQR